MEKDKNCIGNKGLLIMLDGMQGTYSPLPIILIRTKYPTSLFQRGVGSTGSQGPWLLCPRRHRKLGSHGKGWRGKGNLLE
jgi:hypothetical protein